MSNAPQMMTMLIPMTIKPSGAAFSRMVTAVSTSRNCRFRALNTTTARMTDIRIVNSRICKRRGFFPAAGLRDSDRLTSGIGCITNRSFADHALQFLRITLLEYSATFNRVNAIFMRFYKRPHCSRQNQELTKESHPVQHPARCSCNRLRQYLLQGVNSGLCPRSALICSSRRPPWHWRPEPSTNQFLPAVPEGYCLQAYDDCGIATRQPHVLMKDCYLWTFNTSDTDAGLKGTFRGVRPQRRSSRLYES